MFQTTALMEPGDSGGPLFDLQGRVIGIHSRIGTNMKRNYEVPVNTFKKFWNELNREQMFTQSGPPVPKLGFIGNGRSDDTGIDGRQVVAGTLADKFGLKADDIIKSVYKKETLTIRELRKALIAARDQAANEITVQVVRDEEDIDLKVEFDVEREAAPEVALPQYEDKTFAEPKAISQLANLPVEFADLESRLDDVCVDIRSELSDGEELEIVGTLIKGTPFLISKNSMVAQEPETKLDGKQVELEVVARDSENDLVLLKKEEVNSVGVELSEASERPRVGSFLLTPDANGDGLVSIISTKSFRSRKQQSRGFLDVMPVNYADRGGAQLQQVNKNGAADKAGLKVGDVVTQVDDTPIRTHMELRRFLGTVDPNNTIAVKVKRGDEELEKFIRLGAYPSMTRHAADMMNKSGRRDGFRKVIPHDADLDPKNCGSPIFDLEGNFFGLNIARNSRVRSYAIPRSIIKELADRN
jgi:S1-C subfamily serine protease